MIGVVGGRVVVAQQGQQAPSPAVHQSPSQQPSGAGNPFAGYERVVDLVRKHPALLRLRDVYGVVPTIALDLDGRCGKRWVCIDERGRRVLIKPPLLDIYGALIEVASRLGLSTVVEVLIRRFLTVIAQQASYLAQRVSRKPTDWRSVSKVIADEMGDDAGLRNELVNAFKGLRSVVASSNIVDALTRSVEALLSLGAVPKLDEFVPVSIERTGRGLEVVMYVPLSTAYAAVDLNELASRIAQIVGTGSGIYVGITKGRLLGKGKPVLVARIVAIPR